MVMFILSARRRSGIWCSLEPVKWCSVYGNWLSLTTRRSIAIPLPSMALDFVSPFPVIALTEGWPVKKSMILRLTSSPASSATLATISISFTVSRRRRRLPATCKRTISGKVASAARIRSASSSATGYWKRSECCARNAMPCNILSCVFFPKPGRCATLSSRHACSNSAMLFTCNLS